MTSFEKFKAIDRMSRTPQGGSTGLPGIPGTYEVTLSHITAPAELSDWLGHVIIPIYHTATWPFIATLAPVWYHK